MIAFTPVPFRRRLGQLSELTSGLTSGLAKQVVAEAEPALRRVIRVERNRFAEAVIEGIPFFGLAAVGYTATRYLVPDGASSAKAAGYIASAASAALGGWWTLRRLTEKAEEPEEPEAQAAPAGPAPEIVRQAADAFVKEAEPRVRRIVDEERARIAAAAQAGLPLAVASAATFLATMFLVKDDKPVWKAVGYSASALLFGAGTWIGLERTKEAA